MKMLTKNAEELEKYDASTENDVLVLGRSTISPITIEEIEEGTPVMGAHIGPLPAVTAATGMTPEESEVLLLLAAMSAGRHAPMPLDIPATAATTAAAANDTGVTTASNDTTVTAATANTATTTNVSTN